MGLDGRKIPSRSQHSALNALLQGAGAIVMKKALVFCDADLQSKYIAGEDYEFVLNVHDEFQIEVKEAIAEDVGEIAKRSIQKAGDYFKFRCPLDGEYDVGDNWSQTH